MPLTNKRANPAAAAADPITLRKRPRQEPAVLEVESGSFSSDVVIGILSRLPVKTLFRFKSVCTNWDAMIPTNPYLVSMHLKNYTNNPATKASLFCSYWEERESSARLYTYRSVSLCPEDDGQPPINLDESLAAKRVICGTENGLFLLRDYLGSSSSHPAYRLWNPATRETGTLPDPTLAPLRHHCSDFAGVGLDLVANEIKVVLIRNYAYGNSNDRLDPPSAAFVYTLRSNRWRELRASGSYPPLGGGGEDVRALRPTCHAYFKGFFYWLVRDEVRFTNRFVLAFDMGRDVFHRISCPSGGVTCRLSVYGDSVALFKPSTGVDCYSGVDVWLLSKSSSSGGLCWIKHSSLVSLPTRSVVEGGWKNGQLVARALGLGLDKSRLILVDIGTQEHKVLIPNCMVMKHSQLYKQSLIAVKCVDMV